MYERELVDRIGFESGITTLLLGDLEQVNLSELPLSYLKPYS